MMLSPQSTFCSSSVDGNGTHYQRRRVNIVNMFDNASMQVYDTPPATQRFNASRVQCIVPIAVIRARLAFLRGVHT